MKAFILDSYGKGKPLRFGDMKMELVQLGRNALHNVTLQRRIPPWRVFFLRNLEQLLNLFNAVDYMHQPLQISPPLTYLPAFLQLFVHAVFDFFDDR